MKNKIIKYLIEDKQIRLYLLHGKQIAKDVIALSLNKQEKECFKAALNITALINAINPGKQRTSFVFSTAKGNNTISTESFSNNTITGIVNFKSVDVSFEGGSLQTISSLNIQYGGTHISHSLLETGNLYRDIEKYYIDSEQTPTYFFPISNNRDSDNVVLLIQPLPFSKEDTVTKVLKQISSINKTSFSFTVQNIEKHLMALFSNWIYLESMDIEYKCNCSKDMFIGLIFSLTKEDIDNVVKNKEQLEIPCPLCGKKYYFSYDDILTYLQ